MYTTTKTTKTDKDCSNLWVCMICSRTMQLNNKKSHENGQAHILGISKAAKAAEQNELKFEHEPDPQKKWKDFVDDDDSSMMEEIRTRNGGWPFD